MNIAFVVTPEQPVPPPKYGGNEKQADIIVRRLVDRGHNVVLYCCPGSTCPVNKKMAKFASMSCEPDFAKDIANNLKDYDIIIDMTAYHLSGQQKGWPVISIMTGDPHKKYPHDAVRNRVYVSKEFAAFNGYPDHPVLHNIIHEAPWNVKHDWEKKNYALFVGVIRPEKGIELAVDACDALGIPIKIGGPVLSRDREFWNTLKHHSCVEYLGIVDNNSEAKWKLFGEAKVFLYPITWCDAGPLAPMEALLAGTPVVGLANGGIQTDVFNGVNGYLASDSTQFDLKVKLTMEQEWEQETIHSSIIDKINPNNYVDDLLLLCERVMAGETW